MAGAVEWPYSPKKVTAVGREPSAQQSQETPSAVLFACSMNAVRSPIAESVMKHFHGRTVYVDSVGARKGELDPFAIEVMDEIGIDISKHKPKTFDELEDTSYDLIITLSPEAQHHAVEMTRTMAADVIFWNTLDPSFIEGNRESRLMIYRQIRDQIVERIKQRFPLSTPSDI
jgi:protein-tyrosine-phosphatase